MFYKISCCVLLTFKKIVHKVLSNKIVLLILCFINNKMLKKVEKGGDYINDIHTRLDKAYKLKPENV